MPSFYDFFAGGGLARLGLGSKWICEFSNDISQKKADAYISNWGNDKIKVDDIYNLSSKDLPGNPDLTWASFPCQDLSLAGNGAGLSGPRSGTFNKFIDLLRQLKTENRNPKIVVLENVIGAITSHKGKDFRHIFSSLKSLNYRIGCIVVDGVLFVPQSRPRLYIIATTLPKNKLVSLSSPTLNYKWHPKSLVKAYETLSTQDKRYWVWWNLPTPKTRTNTFADMLEQKPVGVKLHTQKETQKLLDLMSDIHLKKVKEAQQEGKLVVGGLYKRVRKSKNGEKLQRAEIRTDGIAGCLRTPTGGSSRQTVMLINGNNIKSRLLSPREAARLMGVPDSYIIPSKYNEAYHLFGDGLVVPAVSWLEKNLLTPLYKI